MKSVLAVLLLLLSALFLPSCQTKKSDTSNLSPEEILKSFQIAEGFKIELVASEPLIADPVAMEIDEYGDIYVVEMPGYPLDTAGSGSIKLLTDSNNDGAPDKSIVFADHLRLPTGIMKWKKGVIVVDVPDILYLEDTNADGKADLKEIMITGLALTNPQHIANTPIYGLDNWIYVAHMGIVTPKVSMEFNDTGSSVRFAGINLPKPLPRDADGRNIRFKPDTHELEQMSGESQYGHTFDSWGHHIGTSNADHLFHEVIAARYLERNPNLLLSNAADYIPDHGNAAEIYPITKNPQHQLLTDVGVITSSCGVTWYQGGLFPDSFNNVTFIAEPVHNLVHADRILEKGASFQASRVYQKKEFLASTDPWFRPVQFYIGPDGALYVIDYFREIIEHPEWMSDSVNKSGQLYNGSDKGRIYRVSPKGTPGLDWSGKIDLAKSSTQELTKLLGHKNIWWRRNAQRLLMENSDSTAAVSLDNYLDSTRSALGTVHALWTLNGKSKINVNQIKSALHHSVAGVRENAILIAELHLANFPELKNELFHLKSDSSAKVRFQLLCTLGNINDALAQQAREEILIKDVEDKWVQVAALSSSGGNEYSIIEKVIPILTSTSSPGKKLFFENAASVIGLSGQTSEIKKLIGLSLRSISPKTEWWQAACLNGLAKSYRARNPVPANFILEKQKLLNAFQSDIPSTVRTAALQVLPLLGIEKSASWFAAIENATSVAADDQAEINFRNDALKLLALDKNKIHTELLERLVSPGQPESIQKNALITYNEISSRDALAFTIKKWKNLTHDVREVAIGIFLSSVDNMNLLLDALQNKQIQSTALSWPRMVELMNNDDNEIRNRSRLLLVGKMEDRDQVYKKYSSSLTMQGDAEQGLTIFKKVCSACHQVGGKYGNAFGPDLASIRNRGPEFIMADILNPNRAIADQYETWNIIKKDGQKLQGIIQSETPTNISVKNLATQQTIIMRSEVKAMEASESSAMPEGLEASISVEEMANLLAFLKNIH